MNTVAAFRTPPSVVSRTATRLGDHKGDGRTDILWRNTATQNVASWQVGANGTAIQSYTGLLPVSTAFKFLASADLDGDGRAEVLWRNVVSGDLVAWKLSPDGTSVAATVVLGAAALEWESPGVATLPSGQKTIVWRNTITGIVTLWGVYSDLTAYAAGFVSAKFLNLSPEQLIVGTADIDGDGGGTRLFSAIALAATCPRCPLFCSAVISFRLQAMEFCIQESQISTGTLSQWRISREMAKRMFCGEIELQAL
jgi:FG-GAP-like repeat